MQIKNYRYWPRFKTASYFICICLSMLTSSCGEQNNAQPFRVVASPDKNLNAVAQANLSGLFKVCPGLNNYSGDLTAATVDRSPMRDYEGGIELKFQVVSRPQLLPAPLKVRSAGHNCYIEFNKDGSRAFIGKSSCHSICEGKLQENDPDLMGREFSLKPASISK